MHANIEKVGLPTVDARPISRSRKALQHELKVPRSAWLDTKLQPLRGATVPDEENAAAARTTSATSRGTCRRSTLRYPSNMPACPGHNWANAISMATPIAHKGVEAGAKVVALTVIDFLMKPELVDAGVGLLPQRADEDDEIHAADAPGATSRRSG